MYRDIPEELRGLIEPVVDHAGFELVDAVLARGRPPWMLRITIDTPAGDGRVSVERCAEVSREIGTQLDVADAISAPYRLEVSSPGLDRVLAREKDFRAACGSEVRLTTRRPIGGRRCFRGLLVGFEDGVARLAAGADEFGIAFADVARANVVYRFSADDFAPAGAAGHGSKVRRCSG